jgi:hypothetical protein
VCRQDLAAVDDVLVPVTYGGSPQRGKIRAGIWLGEALAPEDLASRNRPRMLGSENGDWVHWRTRRRDDLEWRGHIHKIVLGVL